MTSCAHEASHQRSNMPTQPAFMIYLRQASGHIPRAAVVALVGSEIYTARWEASPIRRVARPGEHAPDVYTYIRPRFCARRGTRQDFVATSATLAAIGRRTARDVSTTSALRPTAASRWLTPAASPA